MIGPLIRSTVHCGAHDSGAATNGTQVCCTAQDDTLDAICFGDLDDRRQINRYQQLTLEPP